MKPRFILSPEAARDIREIWSYIADDSIRAARRVRLGENPLIGHSREDLTAKPVLFWPVGAYLIIYDPRPRPIQIAAHAALS